MKKSELDSANRVARAVLMSMRAKQLINIIAHDARNARAAQSGHGLIANLRAINDAAQTLIQVIRVRDKLSRSECIEVSRNDACIIAKCDDVELRALVGAQSSINIDKLLRALRSGKVMM